jgi:hypothetical protein
MTFAIGVIQTEAIIAATQVTPHDADEYVDGI